MRGPAGAALVALVLVAAPAGCGSVEPRATGAVPEPVGPVDRVVLAVLGGDETEDPPGNGSLTRAWEQRVFATLPPGSVLVDVSDRRPTAAVVLREQLPRARAQRPTAATVWLGAADAEFGTPPEDFRAALAIIVAGLQDAGARRVLLLGHRPDEVTPTDAGRRYGAATEAVAAATGARPVGLRPGPVTQESVAAAVAPHVRP